MISGCCSSRSSVGHSRELGYACVGVCFVVHYYVAIETRGRSEWGDDHK